MHYKFQKKNSNDVLLAGRFTWAETIYSQHFSLHRNEKKKKPIGPLAIPEKDFKRPENLEIMSIFLGIHK